MVCIEDRKLFARKLIEYRIASCSTQTEIIERLELYGISESQFKRAERGCEGVSAPYLARIAMILNLDVTDMPVLVPFMTRASLLDAHIKRIRVLCPDQCKGYDASLRWRQELCMKFLQRLPQLPEKLAADMLDSVKWTSAESELVALECIADLVHIAEEQKVVSRKVLFDDDSECESETV